MLEYLRNAAERPVAKILIALLAFSFVGWGVAEWIFGNVAGDTTLVRVGDAEISLPQFNAERSREMAQLDKDAQRAVYTDAAAGREFNQKILTKMATQRMAENRADDLGFFVTDARIAREIREFPEFHQNGQFSAFLFDTVLMNSGYSEADFAAVLRGQVMRSMVLGAFSAPVPVADFAARATYNARNAMRDIDYVTVNYSDFKAENPTDDDLRTFYATRPHVVPEMRTVSYVLITGDLSKPDEYDAAYATAQKVEDDIISGESLEVAANNHKAKYVALKPMARDAEIKDEIMTDVMIARAFDMDAELESELIETKKGFVIMRVDNVAPSHNAEFEDVKKDLVADWKKDAQKKQAYLRANEILVDLNQTGNFDGAKSANVSRTTGAALDVLSAAFNSAVGSNSIVPGADAFYVLRVNGASAPAVNEKKVAEVKSELEKSSLDMVTDDYNSFLIREYPVEINEKVYERFLGNK